MAPEYVNDNVLSLSCDVYSMEVIILEVLIGMKAIDNFRADKSLAAWAGNVMKSGIYLIAYASFDGMFPPGQFKRAQTVALLCISSKTDSRSDINDVANLFSSRSCL
ncbi:hypothetical protein Drorol1_Dr00002120 [Drosera rotundifolia]